MGSGGRAEGASCALCPQDMDYSRIVERLLKLAVSGLLGGGAWERVGLSWHLAPVPHRSPTTSSGSSSSTGSSTPA